MRFSIMNLTTATRAGRKAFIGAAATGFALTAATGAHAQTVLTGFNFNTVASNTTLFASTTGQSTTITTNFDPTFITNFGGSTINAQNGDGAGQALALQGGTNNNQNGNYIQVALSTVGFNAVSLNFATQRTGTGFTGNTVFYSTTGTGGTFAQLTAGTYTPAAAFALQTVDFSAITGLNNNANAVLRIVFNGATSAAGNNRIDNLTVNGTAITGAAAPEPGTLALLGTVAVPGMGLLAARRRRKSA